MPNLSPSSLSSPSSHKTDSNSFGELYRGVNAFFSILPNISKINITTHKENASPQNDEQNFITAGNHIFAEEWQLKEDQDNFTNLRNKKSSKSRKHKP
jgi:hypothetical protein